MFVLLQAFFSGIETGLISVRKPRLENMVRKGDRRSRILDFFIRRPALMMSLCLFGTNVSVVCSALCTKELVEASGLSSNWALVGAQVLLTITLLAAEIIPKDWFRQAPFERCRRFMPLLYFAYFVLYIPVWMLARFTELIVRLFAVKQTHHDSAILLREDFRLLLRESEEGKIIDPINAALLDKAVDFYQFKAGDLMIPREKVLTIPASMTVQEAVDFCRTHGYSRYPVKVTGGNREIWAGIFSVYDAVYMLPDSDWQTTRVTACLRPLNRISAAADLGEAVRKSQTGSTPLLTVIDHDDSNTYLGVITPLDVVQYLFRREVSASK